jgi:hypothetical protein
MPSPARPAPIKVYPDSARFTNGIVGVYTDLEVDALIANLPAGGGEPAITVHAGSPPVPLSGDPTPQELEDSFAVLSNGLHYYPDNGSLVAVLRGEYQTTITITGAVKSVAQIVKSSAGLPTPENPSMIVTQNADGKWFRVKGDRLDQPFGDPEIVDIFKLVGSGGTVDLSSYYTKPEVDAKVAVLQQGVDDANLGVQSVADQIPFVAEQIGIQTEAKLALKADQTTVATLSTTLMNSIMEVNGLVAGKADQSEFAAFQGQYGTLESEFREYFRLLNQGFETVVQKDDVYTKSEVDAKLEADKDFSIANDNVLLGQITSLQEIVSNLGTDIGTGQIDVLDAIRDVEIEPSMVSLTGDANSPIAWKGGLSLTPAKEGDHWRLNWNDGKAIHTLVHGDEFTSANIIAALVSQDVSVSNLQAGGFDLNELGMGAAGDRLITQVAGGPENTVAYLSDLSGYAPISTTTLITTQLQAVFDSIYTRPESDDRYAAKSDNTQNLLAKTVVAQAVGFGDSALPPVALAYTDSGEGYGERLVLTMGLTNEYLVYKSDLDTLFPAIDTSQFSTTVTVAALDARINTLESTRATTTTTAALDTRIKSLESKSAATSNINDASNAALKKSILDAVALMLAGGTKQPPADIGWTACRNFGSGDHPTAQARMIGGVIELRGTLSYPSGTTGDQSFCRLPVGFPFAELNTSVPAAARVTSGSVAVAAYVTFSSLSANLGFDTASRANDIFLTGIKVKAAY